MSTTVLYWFFLSCCFIHLIRNTSGTVTLVQLSGPSTVNEGSTANYTCSGTCNNGTCQYLITYPGGQKSTPSVQWTNIQRKEGATVKCTVTDSRDRHELSFTKEITINYPPTVTLSLTDSTLECHADGKPANYNYRWFQTVGKVVVRDGTSVTTDGSINIPLADNYTRRGDYMCSVSNGIGDRVNKSFTGVKFSDAPLLVSNQKEYNISKGDILTTTFDVYAYPDVTRSDITVQNADADDVTHDLEISIAQRSLKVDFIDKQVYVNGTRVSVTYPAMDERFFYDTTVNIANTKGSVTAQVNIRPQGPPDVPSDFAIVGTTHNSITVSFTSGFFNGANQTLRVEYKRSSSGEWRTVSQGSLVGSEKFVHKDYTVYDLEPETMYMLRAFAENMYGRSDDTYTLESLTLEAPISKGAIAGIIIGSLVGLIIIIIVVIIIYKRRPRQQAGKDATARYLPNLQQNIMVYDNNIYGNEDGSPAPGHEIIPDSPSAENYMNTTFQQGIGVINSPDDPSSENYMNTNFQQGIGKDIRAPEHVQGDVSGSLDGLPLYFDLSSGETGVPVLEDNYMNVDNTKPAGAPTHVQSDVSGSLDGLPLYIDLSSGETRASVLEDNYMNVDSPKPPASEKETPVLDDIYLDMDLPTDVAVGEVSKQVTNGSKVPAGHSQYPKADTPEEVLGESYENVAQYKKDKPVNKSSKTGRTPRMVTSDSIPEQEAPPPPPPPCSHLNPTQEEPHYINYNITK